MLVGKGGGERGGDIATGWGRGGRREEVRERGCKDFIPYNRKKMSTQLEVNMI